jgi:hypothetical protein
VRKTFYFLGAIGIVAIATYAIWVGVTDEPLKTQLYDGYASEAGVITFSYIDSSMWIWTGQPLTPHRIGIIDSMREDSTHVVKRHVLEVR